MKLAPQYSELLGVQKMAQGIADMEAAFSGKMKVSAWVRRHPKLAVSLAKNIFVGRLTSPWRKSERKSEEETTSNVTHRQEMLDAVESIEKEIATDRALLAIHAMYDQKFYTQDYLSGEPFIRLSLRNFSGKNDFLANETLEVFLVLHRSGVAIMTFAAPIEDGISTDSLIAGESAAGLVFSQTTTCEDLWKNARPYSESYKTLVVEDEKYDGTHWRTIEWREPIDLAYIFSLYQERVIAACGGRWTEAQEEWLCYPTLILGKLDCCKTRSRWIKRHRVELAGLVGRMASYQDMSPNFVDYLLERDKSVQRSRSSYYLSSNTVFVEWDFVDDDDNGYPRVEDAFRLVLIENFLLQYWQIRDLDILISRTRIWTRKTLEKMQHDVIMGLEEQRMTMIKWGNAQDIVTDILVEAKVDRLQARVTSRLGTLTQLIGAMTAAATARRGFVISMFGLTVAALLGMPALSKSLDVISGASFPNFLHFAEEPIVAFARGGDSSTLKVYLVLIALILSIACVNLAWRSRLRVSRKGLGKFGMQWEGEDLIIREPDVSYRHGRPVFSESMD
ncbi:hypothetical protein [Actinomadura pelletieri]|uniref:hypothetical protein n=1 Tax=Actinomadura pelletieri TaxID=111805 RepID=UPI0011C366D8|nr:hypothetical protein [Actinomadura pelletieri]